MQTALTQRTFLAGPAVRTAAPTSQRCRSAMVVRAEAGETRRAILTGVLAGALAIGASKAQAMELIDDRKVRETGFDIIYEARDLDLPQAERDGLTQSRQNIEETKARIKEAERRIDSALPPLIKKEYWTLAREELRGQVGTLRFDLNVLADAKPKAEKKQAQALKKKFLEEAEAFDFAIRKKSPASAAAGLEATKASLDDVLAFVM